MANKLRIRNVTINGRRTSLRMEEVFWDGLSDICEREGKSLHELCSLVDLHRHGSSRTSAVRAFIVTYFRAVAGKSLSGISDRDWTGLIDKISAAGR